MLAICRPVSTCYSTQPNRLLGLHPQRIRNTPSRARKTQLRVSNLWLGADDWQKTLSDDCKYLGTGTLTLFWRSDKNEDDFLQMCEAVTSSSKFGNLAELSLHCEHLPLDSRFIRCLQHRPQLRVLDIHCWTFFDRTTCEKDSTTLRSLSGLKKVGIDMCDSTAFPDAWNTIVKKLPPVQDLWLHNRGSGYSRLNAGNLPRIKEGLFRNFKIDHGFRLLVNGRVYKKNCC